MQNYYDLILSEETRWVLSIGKEFDDGEPIDIWAYNCCKFLDEPKAVPFRVRNPGRQMDFTPTALGTIVVSNRMNDVIESVAPGQIQRIPAKIGCEGNWEVLNILHRIDCINHQESNIQYFPADDSQKPNKPRGVTKLVINKDAASDHDIFVPQDWEVARIVSERLKNALEETGISGISYVPV